MKEALIAFEKTFKEFSHVLSSFTEEEINRTPFAGSWTAGQVARHVIKSSFGFIEVINGPVKETERKPDTMVDQIKSDFLNFTIQMESPAFIIPENTRYQKESLLQTFRHIEVEVRKAIQTLDLTKTCTSFELPVYGALTRLEAVYFIIYHTQRHIHQLKNILQHVGNKPAIAN